MNYPYGLNVRTYLATSARSRLADTQRTGTTMRTATKERKGTQSAVAEERTVAAAPSTPGRYHHLSPLEGVAAEDVAAAAPRDSVRTHTPDQLEYVITLEQSERRVIEYHATREFSAIAQWHNRRLRAYERGRRQQERLREALLEEALLATVGQETEERSQIASAEQAARRGLVKRAAELRSLAEAEAAVLTATEEEVPLSMETTEAKSEEAHIGSPLHSGSLAAVKDRGSFSSPETAEEKLVKMETIEAKSEEAHIGSPLHSGSLAAVKDRGSFSSPETADEKLVKMETTEAKSEEAHIGSPLRSGSLAAVKDRGSFSSPETAEEKLVKMETIEAKSEEAHIGSPLHSGSLAAVKDRGSFSSLETAVRTPNQDPVSEHKSTVMQHEDEPAPEVEEEEQEEEPLWPSRWDLASMLASEVVHAVADPSEERCVLCGGASSSLSPRDAAGGKERTRAYPVTASSVQQDGKPAALEEEGRLESDRNDGAVAGGRATVDHQGATDARYSREPSLSRQSLAEKFVTSLVDEVENEYQQRAVVTAPRDTMIEAFVDDVITTAVSLPH